MRLSRKSVNSAIDIKDFYAIKVGSIWRGLKQEPPAFWWLCIYLFLEYIRPASLYPVIDVLPWTQIALLFVLITALFDKSIRWVRRPVNVLFVIFFSIVLLSGVFAFQPADSWEAINVVINWILVYFMIICIIDTEKRFFIFLLLFLLVNFKMSQHGFISFAGRGFAYAPWGVIGSPGWFRNAGDFGIAMLIFSPVAIAFVMALKPYWGLYKRLFFYFMPLTGLVTIIGTSSRGVQLGLVAIGLWFLFKSRLGVKALMGILVIGSLLYVILPDEMFDEFTIAGEDSTSIDRLAHWEFGIDVALEHPVLGIGYDNWLNYCDFMNPDGLGNRTQCKVPHNTYISAGAEIGLIGLMFYLMLALSILRINARTRINAKRAQNNFIEYLAHGLDAGLVGYMVATIFFSNLFYPMFWFQLAMTVALNQVSKRKSSISNCQQ